MILIKQECDRLAKQQLSDRSSEYTNFLVDSARLDLKQRAFEEHRIKEAWCDGV